MSKVLEVSFDSLYNSNISFLPLGQLIRGRFVLSRVPEPLAAAHVDKLGHEIPSQRLQINLETGEGRIYEPLWEDNHREVKQRIEQMLKMSIPMQGPWVKAHMPTWVFWISRLLASNNAILMPGSAPFPTDIQGTPRVSNFARKDAIESTDKELKAEFKKIKEENEVLNDALVELSKRIEALEGSSKRR